MSAEISGISIFSFSLSNSTPEHVTELDGSQTKDFFTVLNQTIAYTDDQIYNLMIYSKLFSILANLLHEKNNPKNNPLIEKFIKTFMDSHLIKESIISYCLRIIEQSKLKFQNSVSPQTITFVNLTLAEAIKILDIMCALNEKLVICPIFF